ncbi:MAG: hypothetical protein J7M38_07450 [Armatimonadetes bacterium]|nr:hypothetical protein [Armatimonadota bacterium]
MPMLLLAHPPAALWAEAIETPHSLLTRPLPGTAARDDYDLARSLEQTLVEFTGVQRARLLITSPSLDSSASRPRHIAVQLTLEKTFHPGSEWVSAIADIVLQVVPGAAPERLTIVESTGRTLYSHGAVRLMPQETSPSHVPAEGAGSKLWLWPAAVAGALAAAVLLLLRGRTSTPSPSPPPSTGPFAFISELSDEELAVALGGERPAVVAAVLARLPDDTRQRIITVLGCAPPQSPSGEPSDEVTTALAEALRHKLSEAQLR